MKPIIFLIALTLMFSACEKGTKTIDERDFYIYLKYWNEDNNKDGIGDKPFIEFDKENTTEGVLIDFEKQEYEPEYTGNNIITINIDNIRFFDALGNYSVTNIKTEEYVNNTWKEDVEFAFDYVLFTELDVVLVLDVSSSLGDDFQRVKEYAQAFVNEIFQNAPNSRVGIVSFSTEVDSLNITSNESLINNYIENLQQGQFTALYDAMAKGISLLTYNSTSKSKILVTFTDGNDNNSIKNSLDIINLLSSNSNETKISSYTIGLKGKGGLDETILQSFALNQGLCAFPNSINELERIFNSFSKSVSTVYGFNYHRNTQPISMDQKRNIRLIVNAKLK